MRFIMLSLLGLSVFYSHVASEPRPAKGGRASYINQATKQFGTVEDSDKHLLAKLRQANRQANDVKVNNADFSNSRNTVAKASDSNARFFLRKFMRLKNLFGNKNQPIIIRVFLNGTGVIPNTPFTPTGPSLPTSPVITATGPTQPTNPSLPTSPVITATGPTQPTNPSLPTSPTNPGTAPTQPTNPSLPTSPAIPGSGPTQPTNPSLPTSPAIPGSGPTQPTNPSLPTNPAIPGSGPTQPTNPNIPTRGINEQVDPNDRNGNIEYTYDDKSSLKRPNRVNYQIKAAKKKQSIIVHIPAKYKHLFNNGQQVKLSIKNDTKRKRVPNKRGHVNRKKLNSNKSLKNKNRLTRIITVGN